MSRKGKREKKLAQKKYTREDYIRIIGMGDKKRGGGRRGGGGGSLAPETVMLAHLMSTANRNVKQPQAVVDSMNEHQVRQVGKMVKKVLNMKRKLPKKDIKKLVRDRNLIDALIKGKGSIATRKKKSEIETQESERRVPRAPFTSSFEPS